MISFIRRLKGKTKMNYIDSDKLLNWFKKINFVDFIFNETTHNEMIRLSKEIFSYLGSKS